jgi:hypothetical protein
MNNKFIQRRIKNLIGDSDLDDGVSKLLINLLEEHIQRILVIKEPHEIYFSQGSVAAFQKAIEEVRLYNKRKLAQLEGDNDEE